MFCILSKRGKIDGETGLRGSAQEAGVAGKTETAGRPKHRHSIKTALQWKATHICTPFTVKKTSILKNELLH